MTKKHEQLLSVQRDKSFVKIVNESPCPHGGNTNFAIFASDRDGTA